MNVVSWLLSRAKAETLQLRTRVRTVPEPTDYEARFEERRVQLRMLQRTDSIGETRVENPTTGQVLRFECFKRVEP